ncbi:MAG: sugar ABC transporter permease [Thermotogae bacterium]|nr:sugar ABC transporter permease [Thermotogota bacterium]
MEKRIGTIKRKENIKGFWLASPYLLFTAIFFGYPFVWLVILAFSKWNFISSPKNIGIDNFTKLFSDPMFWTVFENTIRFMLEFIPMVLVFSIALAIAFSKAKHMRSFFAMSFLIANVSSGVAYSILFEQIFASNGPVNNFLYDTFGIFIPWFSDPNWAMFSIAIMVTWKFMGYYALIFLSGLQSIPNELYEAAKLDGANRWTLFWKITLPLLNPSFVMVVVLAITLAFGIFTEPFIITGGGPLNSTQTFMMIIYTDAFEKYQAGYSATIAIVAAGLSFLMIFIVRKLIEKNVSFS